MDLLFMPIQPFICHPERGAYVAVFFFIFWFWHRRYLYSFKSTPSLIASIIWFAYSAWELNACAANIRIDLLIIYPVLMITTVVALVSSVSLARKKSSDSDI